MILSPNQALRNNTLVIIIGLVIVGGIGVFSIYLQSDKVEAEIQSIVKPNAHCFEEFDDVYYKLESDPSLKFNKEIQDKFSKLMDDRCYDTFRDWMPESHPGWDQMIVRENNGIDTCKRYFVGEIVFTEENYEYYDPVQRCENLLKK